MTNPTMLFLPLPVARPDWMREAWTASERSGIPDAWKLRKDRLPSPWFFTRKAEHDMDRDTAMAMLDSFLPEETLSERIGEDSDDIRRDLASTMEGTLARCALRGFDIVRDWIRFLGDYGSDCYDIDMAARVLGDYLGELDTLPEDIRSTMTRYLAMVRLLAIGEAAWQGIAAYADDYEAHGEAEFECYAEYVAEELHGLAQSREEAGGYRYKTHGCHNFPREPLLDSNGERYGYDSGPRAWFDDIAEDLDRAGITIQRAAAWARDVAYMGPAQRSGYFVSPGITLASGADVDGEREDQIPCDAFHYYVRADTFPEVPRDADTMRLALVLASGCHAARDLTYGDDWDAHLWGSYPYIPVLCCYDTGAEYVMGIEEAAACWLHYYREAMAEREDEEDEEREARDEEAGEDSEDEDPWTVPWWVSRWYRLQPGEVPEEDEEG